MDERSVHKAWKRLTGWLRQTEIGQAEMDAVVHDEGRSDYARAAVSRVVSTGT